STSIPSPVVLTMRPWCSAIFGSTSSRRSALRRSSVPSSSASAANTPPHRQPGSRRGDASGSRLLARRQAQAREIKLALLRIPQEIGVCYHNRCYGAQPLDDLACVVQSTHMRVAGGEIAIRYREAWILLDCKEQFWYCLIEPSTQKMS